MGGENGFKKKLSGLVELSQNPSNRARKQGFFLTKMTLPVYKNAG